MLWQQPEEVRRFLGNPHNFKQILHTMGVMKKCVV